MSFDDVSEWNMSDEERLGVKELRLKLLETLHLRTQVDDKFLLRYIRHRKGNVAQAYEKVLYHYRAKTKYINAGYYKIMKPLEMREVFEAGMFRLLRKSDSRCRVLALVRLCDWDPEKVDCFQNASLCYHALEYVSMLENAQKIGVCFLLDANGFGWSHLRSLTPSHMLATIDNVMRVFPVRIESIVSINTNKVAIAAWQVLRYLLSEKLRKRTHIYGTDYCNDLNNHVAKEDLPDEYGGSAGTLNNKREFCDYVFKYSDQLYQRFVDNGFIKSGC